MTSLHWQTSLQNRQCHALCTLGRTSKCDKVLRPICLLQTWLRPICLWSLHGALFNAGWHCQYLRQQFGTFDLLGASDTAMLIKFELPG